MEAGEVALGSLVIAGGDAPPGLQPVDQALDGVPVLVELGVVTDRPTAPAALLLSVGGLVDLLRDDGLDAASAQVGAVASGRVGLVPGDRVGPGAGAADRPADPDLPQYGDELRAVGGLPLGQDERQRAAPALACDMDLAGLPAPGASEQGGLQAELAAASDAPPLFPLRVTRAIAVMPVLSLRAAPFCRAFSASSAAFSRAARASGSMCIPAAS